MSEKLPEAYVKAPGQLMRAAGQLTLMYIFEKAQAWADKRDEKLARLTDLGDQDGNAE